MEIVTPAVEILTPLSEIADFPRRIEEAGRVCYRSEDRTTEDSADRFCEMLIRRGHESVLEHESIRVRLRLSRTAAQQITRHRIGVAFSMESQRYVCYKDGPLQVIAPAGYYDADEGSQYLYRKSWADCERAYKKLLASQKPQDARAVLPTATACALVMSANVRQWRHIFRERALNPRAQEEIRFLMTALLCDLTNAAECLFEDLYDDLDYESNLNRDSLRVWWTSCLA